MDTNKTLVLGKNVHLHLYLILANVFHLWILIKNFKVVDDVL